MVNGKWLPILQSAGKRQHNISFVYRSYQFTHARSESINADSLNSQLLQLDRKKEWRPATADSSPQAVTCQHCDTHYTLVGLVGPTRYQ